jgi:predicted nuclease of predicted toxin-antitoxin system
MALRFFFDECADEDVARALLAAGVDVVTVTSLGRKGMQDEDQLLYARHDDRVLYTTDPDFLQLAADWQQRSEPFAGIAYHQANARTKRQIIDGLLLMHGVLEPSDLHNRVEYL